MKNQLPGMILLSSICFISTGFAADKIQLNKPGSIDNLDGVVLQKCC
ncbi:MAG: hypothetical protein ACO2ZM_09870 [Francisellaceae bacterium]